MSKPIALLRLEDLNNRPGIEMNGWIGTLVPYAAGDVTVEAPFKAGVVYTCLLKKTTIATDGKLPDQSAVAFETEATGDMLLVIGKATQQFI